MSLSTLQRIEHVLQERFSPLHLEVQDDSARHAGHAGARSGAGHYRVAIVSEVFKGKTLLEQHRLVKEALGDLFGSQIHALQLKTSATP
ncbi:MAG: BolA family protein [bacterium]